MRKTLSKILLFLFTVLPAALAWGDSKPGWEESKRWEHLVIYNRQIPGSDLLSVKAVTVIDAGIDVVATVLRDIEAQVRWRTNVTEAKLLETKGKNGMVIFNQMKMPWPMEKRYLYIFGNILVEAQEGRGLVQLEGIDYENKDAYPGKGIQIKDLKVEMSLDYLARNKTGFTYSITVDPAGKIPKSLVNLFNRWYIYYDVENLKKLCMEEKYRAAALSSPEYRLIEKLSGNPASVKAIVRSRLLAFSHNKEGVDLLIQNPRFIRVILDHSGELGEISYLGGNSEGTYLAVVKKIIYYYLTDFGISPEEAKNFAEDPQTENLALRSRKSIKGYEKDLQKLFEKHYNAEDPNWRRLKKELDNFYSF